MSHHKCANPSTCSIHGSTKIGDPIHGSTKIGDPIWQLDPRDGWAELVIVDETRMSWIAGHLGWPANACEKVSKKDLATNALHNWCGSKEEVDRRKWVRANRYRLSEVVQRCFDHETLQKIAALVNYKEIK